MNPVSSYSPSIHAASLDAVGPSSSGGAPPSVGALLPEPKNVDVGLAIAQMAIERAYTSRSQARADRRHAEEAMRTAEQEQLTDMRREADERCAAAQAEAWGKIAEGGLGVTGSLASTTVLDRLRIRPEFGVAISESGKVGAGVGGLWAAGSRHDADEAGASAKQAENLTSAERRAMERADDEIKEARDHVRTALDFLREFQSTQSKTMSSAIRG
jgi:hypothetical protein